MILESKPARLIASCLLALALLGGTACSSDGSEGGDEKKTTTTVAPEVEESPDATLPDDTAATTAPSDDDADDQPTGDAAAYIDAMARSASTAGIASEDQGRCLGEKLVAIVGIDRIVAADMSPEDFAEVDDFSDLELDRDTAEEMYDAFGPCGIDIAKAWRSIYEDSEETTPQQQACVDEVYSDEAVRKVFVEGVFLGGEEEDLFEASESCFADD